MPAVPGLRSNYAKIGRLVYFGRMLDKIRLHAAGQLPADYQPNLGKGFDLRCCTFLGVAYAEVVTRTLAGGSDEEVLAWCHDQGGARSDDQCLWWSNFLMKRGWRDEASPLLRQRIVEFGLVGKPIETMFDLNEYDEGRDPVAAQAWSQ
jgi:gluconokinase